jgi:hypothetical protein
MKWYDAARDFLYVHPWLQGLIFGSLIAIAGGGSFLHRRKERKHARDLVKANEQANSYREEANRLSGALLKVHTAQAETAKLITQALNQQGNVLDEQTKIMAKQFELLRRAETKVERNSLFTAVVDMQGAFVSLERRLSRIQLGNVTQKDSDEVNRYFEELNKKAVDCMKQLLTAVHISHTEKKYFSDYSRKLSDLLYTGEMRKAIADVTIIRTNSTDIIFHAKLGDLGKTPEIGEI